MNEFILGREILQQFLRNQPVDLCLIQLYFSQPLFQSRIYLILMSYSDNAHAVHSPTFLGIIEKNL